MYRFNLNFKHVEQLSQTRYKQLCGVHSCADTRTADGKSLLHCLLAEPTLVAAELQHCVRHSPDQGWRKGSDTTNKSDFRGTTLASLEQRILPFVEELLSIAPTLAAAADHSGTTPLHLAAREGLAVVSRLLLRSKFVNPNAQDESGQTPLHATTIYGSIQIAQLLIEHGADRKLPDKYGASFDDYLKSPGIGIYPEDAEALFGIKTAPAMKDPKPADSDGAPCLPDGGWKTGTPEVDDEDMQCDIDQRTDLDPDVWYKEYYLRGRPVLLRGELPLSERCSMRKSNMRGKQLLESLKCGATAYPTITYQEFCPQPCTVESLERGTSCYDNPVGGGLEREYKPTAVLGHRGKVNHKSTPQWAQMVPRRFHFGTPPFHQLCTAYVKSGNKQLFMSGKGAGATMHFHAAAYNVLFFGYKKWIMLPPSTAEFSGMPVANYIDDLRARKINKYECMQRPGDVILLPRNWGHATINPFGFALGLGNLYHDQKTESSLVAHHSSDDSMSRTTPWLRDKTWWVSPMKPTMLPKAQSTKN